MIGVKVVRQWNFPSVKLRLNVKRDLCNTLLLPAAVFGTHVLNEGSSCCVLLPFCLARGKFLLNLCDHPLFFYPIRTYGAPNRYTCGVRSAGGDGYKRCCTAPLLSGMV
jgi:hypothetical protein